MFPANIALADTVANTLALFGSITLRAPICRPIEAKLANPHKAYVETTIDRFLIRMSFRF
jgi:hypothetical protein